jgi:thioredoxin 1
MKTPLKIIIVLAIAGLTAGAIVLKQRKEPTSTSPLPSTPVASIQPPTAATASQKLPRLLDLGATKCIPCKKMAPILEGLKKEFGGKLVVEFIDVWQNPDAAKQYGIEVIPTQIFYDATGKELFRHIGFFGREDILGKWKELGVNL